MYLPDVDTTSFTVDAFRHTMDANIRLHRRGTYVGSLLSGKHDDEPDEQDADNFARKIEGTCTCPNF